MSLVLRDVSVRFADRPVLNQLSLDVETSTTLAITGPSGVGKTTVLRVIAGLQSPDEGRIFIDGADVTHTPPHRRGVGMVFQDNRLFPHLSVIENIAYGLTSRLTNRRKMKPEVLSRSNELLHLVGLEGREDSDVGVLSGGESKRVALARALAPLPSVLLLDEPLTGLDVALRERLLNDLHEILRAARTTAVLVSHDHDEVRQLATSTIALTPPSQ